MSPRYLFDTDTCIFMRRGGNREIERRLRALEVGAAVISVVNLGELWRGVYRTEQREKSEANLRAFLQLMPVLPMPVEAGDIYARIRVDLERAGQIIGNNDLWIAAHALAAGLTLVSGNIREFRRVKGLKVENWIR